MDDGWPAAGRRVLVCGARFAGQAAARALLARGARVLITDRERARTGWPTSSRAGAEFVGDLTRTARRRPRRHVARAGGRTIRCSPRPRRAASRCSARSSSPGGCAAADAARLAARSPGRTARRRPSGCSSRSCARPGRARTRRGQRRRLDHRRGDRPDDVRRAGGRGVELPAVLVLDDRARPRRAAQPRARSSRLARVDGRLRRGQGEGVARRASRSRTLDDPAVVDAARRPAGPHVLARCRTPTTPCATGGSVHGDDGAASPRADVRPAGPHNVANALAAAALAEGYADAGRRSPPGCAPSSPTRTATSTSPTVGGVAYVDDSKATNPHAARASLLAYDRIVWIAGGQLKDAPVEELVAEVAPRLRGAVLLGADRALIAAALRRHAPDVPVIEVDDDRRWGHAAGGARRGRTRASGRHGAARTRGRVLRHVHRLRGARAGSSPPPPAHCSDELHRQRCSSASATRCAVPRSRTASGSSTSPTRRCSCCCSSAAGLLGFGILMAVSTTIAASHDDAGDGRGVDLVADDQAGHLRRDRPAVVLVRRAAAAAGVPHARVPDPDPRPGRAASPCSCRASASASTARGAGSTSARCSCSRPSSPRSACCCGARTCWPASSSSARCARARHLFLPLRARLRGGRSARHARTRPRHDLLLHADPARPAVDGRHAAALLRHRRRSRRGRRSRRSPSPSRTGCSG